MSKICTYSYLSGLSGVWYPIEGCPTKSDILKLDSGFSISDPNYDNDRLVKQSLVSYNSSGGDGGQTNPTRFNISIHLGRVEFIPPMSGISSEMWSSKYLQSTSGIKPSVEDNPTAQIIVEFHPIDDSNGQYSFSPDVSWIVNSELTIPIHISGMYDGVSYSSDMEIKIPKGTSLLWENYRCLKFLGVVTFQEFDWCLKRDEYPFDYIHGIVGRDNLYYYGRTSLPVNGTASTPYKEGSMGIISGGTDNVVHSYGSSTTVTGQLFE